MTRGWVILGGGLLLAALVRPAFGAPAALTLGVVPQMSPWALARRWTPLIKAWSARSGYRIVLRTAPTIARFERRVARGTYDLVFLNPTDYVRYRSRYRAFARGRGFLQGILVVRRYGPRDLRALAGRVIAFPARAALAASVMPRHMLRRAGIAFTARYVGSHDAVYRGVAAGLFAAGGGIRRTFDLLAPRLRGKLRILWRGPKTLPHPFAARRDLPVAEVGRLRAALLALPASAPQLLKPLGFTGFRGATDRDYRRFLK